MSKHSFDDIARRLAEPMPRRRALRVAGAALVGAVAVPGLRPRSAAAAGYPCTGLNPLKCSNGGAQVCVPSDWNCCSNELCAGACEPWEACSPGAGCDDTPLLCTDKKAAGTRGGGDPTRPKFCSVRLKSGPSTCYPSGRTLTWGWCCHEGETCGKHLGDCECEGTECGNACCQEGQVCADEIHSVCCQNNWKPCSVGRDHVVKCCPPRDTCCFNHKTHTAVCCDNAHPCIDGKCECKKGEERCGATCCHKGQSCVAGVCLHD